MSSKISTPDLCDQHGDAVRVADPVFRHFGGRKQFGGQVVTIKCFEDNSLVAKAVSTAGDGGVLVVDGGGSCRRSLLGDNLASQAVQYGWSGIVIFGALRDVEELATLPLGILALASVPRKTEKRGEGQTGIPVSLAGVTIQPGEYVYADESGLIVAESKLI